MARLKEPISDTRPSGCRCSRWKRSRRGCGRRAAFSALTTARGGACSTPRLPTSFLLRRRSSHSPLMLRLSIMHRMQLIDSTPRDGRWCGTSTAPWSPDPSKLLNCCGSFVQDGRLDRFYIEQITGNNTAIINQRQLWRGLKVRKPNFAKLHTVADFCKHLD